MRRFMGVAQSALRVLLSGDYLILHGEENKRSTVYLLPLRKCTYLPMQKVAKICSRRSSGVNAPVISPSAFCA